MNRPWRLTSTTGPLLVLLVWLAPLTPVTSASSGGAQTSVPRVHPDTPVTAVDLRRGEVSQNSPTLAARSPDGRLLALANRIDSPDFGCSLHLSDDGGRLWRPAEPVPRLPAGAEKCYGPEIAFDPAGRLYFLFVGLRGGGNSPMGVFLTTSSDRGLSFSKPRRVLGPERYMVRMAIDPRARPDVRLHLVWLEARSDPPVGGLPSPPNPIMAAYSDDGGGTFSAPVQVSDPARDRVAAPSVAIGPDGVVHVLYYDLEDDARDYQGLEGPTWEGTWSLVLSSSADRGRRFQRHTVVDDAVVPTERVLLIYTMPPPGLVADRKGRLFAAWHDNRNGDWDVLLRRSIDGGQSWGAPVRVNDDQLGNGRHQYLPRLAASPKGRIDAIFYDRREDPGNRSHHVYYAFSDDGGLRFDANLRLTSTSSDSDIGPRYELPSQVRLPELGSRLALVSGEAMVVAAWTDARNSLPGAKQDVFSARVQFPGVPTPAPPAQRSDPDLTLVLVGSALVLGSVLVAWRRRRRAVRGRNDGGAAQMATVAAALVVAGACGSQHREAPRPAVVDVSMLEYAFRYDNEVPAGRVVWRAHNSGRSPHDMLLVSLPDDFPPLDRQLRGQKRRAVATVARLPAIEPGGRGTFAVDLDAGRYGLICFVTDPDGKQHADKGMSSELRVSG